MVFEFLENFSAMDAAVILIILVIFIIFVKKLIDLIKNVIIIAIASVIFPLVANRFLNTSLPTDLQSLLQFALLGIAAYSGYVVLRMAYRVLKKGTKLLPKGQEKVKKDVKVVEKIKVVKEPQEQKHAKQQLVIRPSRAKSEKELFGKYVLIQEEKKDKKKADEKK